MDSVLVSSKYSFILQINEMLKYIRSLIEEAIL